MKNYELLTIFKQNLDAEEIDKAVDKISGSVVEFNGTVESTDKIGRKNLPEDLEIVKKMAYKNIDQSLKLCLEKQEKYLQQKGIKLHKDTKKLLAKLTKEL